MTDTNIHNDVLRAALLARQQKGDGNSSVVTDAPASATGLSMSRMAQAAEKQKNKRQRTPRVAAKRQTQVTGAPRCYVCLHTSMSSRVSDDARGAVVHNQRADPSNRPSHDRGATSALSYVIARIPPPLSHIC